MPDSLPGGGIGALCEVRNDKNDLLFVGKVTGFDRGVATVEESGGGPVPRVVYGAPVKLSIHAAGRDVAVFGGLVRGSSRFLWKVGELRRFQASELRAAFRQKTNARATVVPLDGSHGPEALKRAVGSPFAAPCRLVDVSVGGVLLACKKGFERGDYLALLGVSFLPDRPPMSFVCRVCRVDESDPAAFRYGCAFEGLSEREEDRLCSVIFDLQRQELHARRRSGLE